MNPDVMSMNFVELPLCGVEDFDYPEIAKAAMKGLIRE